MHIVIDMPEEQYNIIKSDLYNTFPAEMKHWGIEAIRNGKPLPKWHGGMIWYNAEEKKPERDTDVLAYCSDRWDCYHFYRVVLIDDTTGEWADGNNFNDNVIKWSYLPPHPIKNTAHWIDDHFSDEWYGPSYTCSNCNGQMVEDITPFCPFCGFSMTEEVNNESDKKS